MTAVQFLLAPQNIAFAVALGLFLALVVVEIIAVSFGAFGDVDTDFDAEPSGQWDVLGWLHFGRVPTLILLVAACLGFTIAGYTLQWVALSMGGQMLGAWVASLIAFPFALLGMRLVGGLVRDKLLKEETAAIPLDALTGKIAIVTLGSTKLGRPSQAKYRDDKGTTHYVLIEPLLEDQTFEVGQEVVLFERHGPLFKVIDPSTSVSDLIDRPEFNPN